MIAPVARGDNTDLLRARGLAEECVQAIPNL